MTLHDVLAQETEGGLNGPRTLCALEATRRLRITVGDGAVLLAELPAVPEPVLLDAARRFIDAGADILLLPTPPAAGTARTIGNIARFHRTVVACPEPVDGFVLADRVDLAGPRPSSGLTVTPGEVPDDVPITDVQDWLDGVRA